MNTTPVQLFASIKNQARRAVYDERDDSAHFEQFHWIKDEGIRRRVLVERAIVRQLVRDAFAAGLLVRVHDGESWATGLENRLDEVMAEVGQCDEERLYVWEPSREQGKDGKYIGSVYLVYGNEGWDVLADYSTAPEFLEVLKGADELAYALGEVTHKA